MKRLLFILLCLFTLSVGAQELSLIPQPAEVEVKKGEFLLEKGTVL